MQRRRTITKLAPNSRFESPIHREQPARLSKHQFGKLRTIDWDALIAFHLVNDVE